MFRNLPTWVTIALLTGLVALRLDERAIGLFHDDGIYAVVGQAMADGRGHRIVSLPGEPYQTKYPPLYAAALAVVWTLVPAPAEAVIWLKRLNLAFVALALLGVWRWSREALHPLSALLAVVVVGMAPGVVGFSDYAMTDVAFLALVVWYLCLWDEAGPEGRARGHVAIALVTAAAILTRSIGVALLLASLAECARRRQWRVLLVHAALPGVAFAGWTAWAAAHRAVDSNPLLSYYVEYETSALGYLFTQPALAAEIVRGNLLMAAQLMALPLGPAWTAFPFVCVPLVVAGAWRSLLARRQLPLLFAALYVGIVLLHPFSPHRYLLALVPLVVLLMLTGAEFLASTLGGGRGVRVAAASIAALLVLLPNIWVYELGRRLPPDTVRGWYGFSLGYDWQGFDETFAWVRSHTGPDAVLGTMFDGAYALHTGRHAVRPWFHLPATYFYPVGAAHPYVGHPSAVLQALVSHGVDYVILDPPKGYVEGEAGIAMLRRLLDLPEAGSELVFTSADGRHEVYRLRPRGNRAAARR